MSQRETDLVTIDRALLQIVFDVAVQSMDFGSGFLDDEEVAALRAVATSLGVDPMKATPYNFTCKYTNTCQPYGGGGPNDRMCRYCKRIV